MARSERTSRFAVPLAVRSSDVTGNCPGRRFLELMHEGDFQASWNILGTVLHAAFEGLLLNPEHSAGQASTKAIFDFGLEWENAKDEGADLIWSEARQPDDMAQLISQLIQVFDDHVRDVDIFETWQRDFEHDPICEYRLEGEIEIDGVLPTTIPYSTEVDCLMPVDDGRYVIVDWKTGRSTSHDPQQIQFYWKLLEWEGEYDIAGGAYVTVTEKGIKVQEVPYPSDVWFEQAILATWARKTANVHPLVPGWYCKYCPVIGVCPVKTRDTEQEWRDLHAKSYLE